MSVAIVDYGSGNLHSAAKAFERAAHECGHEQPIVVTGDPDQVARADRVVLPGVGAFADCRRGLDAVSGMVDALNLRVRQQGRPFLGICVGMQLMAERGLEHEITPGFGWIGGEIAEMDAPGLRLPQMGWNSLDFVPGSHKLLDGLVPGDHVYFVHSYALIGGDPGEAIAMTDYGVLVVAMVAFGNRAGTQFHVEKSQEVGIRILSNFLRWTP